MTMINEIKNILSIIGTNPIEIVLNYDKYLTMAMLILIVALIIFISLKGGMIWWIIKFITKTFAKMLKDSMKR